jgi:hypothetical protein
LCQFWWLSSCESRHLTVAQFVLDVLERLNKGSA